MRIALDVTPVTTGVTGVARYAKELARELVLAGVDIAPFAIGRGPYPADAGVRRVRVPLSAVQRGWSTFGRPRAEDLVGKVDLVHCLDLLPVPSRVPLVMTVHDLLAVEQPDLHTQRQVEQQRAQLSVFGRADLLLSDSKATAEALVRHGVDRAKVVVIPLGVTALPPAVAPPISGRYLLAVGELGRRKNLPMLIAAFQRARLPDDICLVLAGPEGSAAAEVLPLLGGRIRWLGRVDDATLAGLYAGALALCFPSFAEGYGLPVLEALSLGLPVVASDLPVTREVAGDAALYLPTSDLDAWVAGLERIVGDAALASWLKARGLSVTAGCTWARTAALTITAYERVLACA